MTERPTPELLRKLLRYEPETGKLFWLPRPESMFPAPRDCNAWNTRQANKEAFTATGAHGYRVGAVFNRNYRLHRVAYAIYHGYWPKKAIDHINGDVADNRIANLRDVTMAVNMKNQKIRSTNTSGYNGVSFHGKTGKWRATIKVGHKSKHLGLYSNIEDAVAARKAADKQNGFTERHGT
jgi:hypothetical protein